jgi:DNA-binding NarL/FixJ family response regulator
MKDVTAPWWDDESGEESRRDDEWREVARKLARPDWDLTEREREVAGLIAEGLSNKEIARKLTVSLNTVKIHVSRVLYKMGVHSRIEAALLWERRRKQ